MICSVFRKSISRISIVGRIPEGPGVGQVADRVDDDHARLELPDQPVHRREVHLQPVGRRPPGDEPEQPFLTQGRRSIPIERMLRTIWLSDSSNAK